MVTDSNYNYIRLAQFGLPTIGGAAQLASVQTESSIDGIRGVAIRLDSAALNDLHDHL